MYLYRERDRDTYIFLYHAYLHIQVLFDAMHDKITFIRVKKLSGCESNSEDQVEVLRSQKSAHLLLLLRIL